jgi:predicted MFS family arabinose efflux permease
VWTAIARQMGHQALRMNLNTLLRHGVFEDAALTAELADRLGGAALLLPGAVVVAAVGMLAVALGLVAGDGWLLGGAAVFGAGFGAAQNLTLLAAFRRAGEGGTTAASAMWNASFDAGTAAGALLLGLLAAGIDLPWTFTVVAAGLLAVLPVAVRSTRH